MVLSHINMKWKQYKWELQKHYYQPNVSKEKIIENMPKNVIKEQWVSLVSYWASEKFKKLSTLGKRAREMHTQVHTIGSKSYAQWKIEFAKLNQREPSGLEMWKRTHTTKSGGYVEGTSTQELMNIAESRVNERLRDSKQPREVVETEVFNEIMHQEDKPNKRVVGYGLGVTRSHVFGIEAQLRKDKIGDCGGSLSDVMGLKSYLLSIERKNDELMRRNDEVMRQNDELMRRNDEVMRKKDEEVEELRAQNQKILTQLALVLDQLQQNQKTIG